ncbi:MAG: DKNYY domain-containing protein [Candidatus Dojkabacteria bacterium]|nr:MAG: DKNYY domain-containing protein [Candidatus Dojkabacteria bacterium]
MNIFSNLSKRVSRTNGKISSLDRSQKLLIFAALFVFIALIITPLGDLYFNKPEKPQESTSIKTKKSCSVYETESIVPQADGQSVESETIAKDFTRKYAPSDCQFSPEISIASLDTASCERISTHVIVDKNNVYKWQYDPGSSNYSTYIVVEEADAESFTNLYWNYYKDNTNLYYDTGENLSIVDQINLESVEVLSASYIKDKNGVYYVSFSDGEVDIRPIPGFDTATFAVVQNQHNIQTYFKDRNGVYYFGSQEADLTPSETVISEADVDTFIVLNTYLLAKDKSHVYYEGIVVPSVDAEAFEELGGGYYRDRSNVYTTGMNRADFEPLDDSDPCTFELLGYTSDSNWSGYAKDENQVYYLGSVVVGADAETFQTTHSQGVYGGYDKNYRYQGKYRLEELE